MSAEESVLQVYQTGPVTVVGFGGKDVLSDINLAVFRDELLTLIKTEECQTLAFDLTGVKLIPSGLLGLLSSARDHGVQVEIYNPSDDVREVLSVTHLDSLMTIRNVPVPTGDDEDAAD